jgi:hypothetical protein
LGSVTLSGHLLHCKESGDEPENTKVLIKILRGLIVTLIFTLSLFLLIVSAILEASIGLLGVCWLVWLTLYLAFQDKMKQARKAILKKLDDDAKQLVESIKAESTSAFDDKKRKAIIDLGIKYEEADQPIDWLNQSSMLFFLAGLFFLFSILCDMAAPFFLSNSPEIAFFIVGIVFLLFAALYAFRVFQIASKPEPEDPELPGIVLLISITFLEVMNIYFLYLFLSVNHQFVSLILSVQIFLISIVISIIAGFVALFRASNEWTLSKKFETLLLFLPYIILALVAITYYFGIIW